MRDMERWLGSIDAALDALIQKCGASCAYCETPAKTWCYECGALVCASHAEHDGVCLACRAAQGESA